MYLAADARHLLGVESLKKDLGIHVQHLAKAHVHIGGSRVLVSQPYARELCAYVSIGLDPKAAEESEQKGITELHRVAEFFRCFNSDKEVVEQEP